MLKEMKSPPLQFLLPNGEVDPKALHVIRDVVQQDVVEAEKAISGSDAPAVPQARGAERLQEAAPLAAPVPQPAKRRGALSASIRKVAGFRPGLRHLFAAAIVAALIAAPWAVLWTFVAGVVIFMASLFYFGTDRVWQRLLQSCRVWARRYPRTAVRWRRKYIRVSTSWNTLLDSTPEGTFDGLYLPDVRKMALAELQYRIALDRRFAALRKDDAATWQ